MNWKIGCFIVSVFVLSAVAWGWAGWSRVVDALEIYNESRAEYQANSPGWYYVKGAKVRTTCLLHFSDMNGAMADRLEGNN